jgi:peroxiredoxin
MWVGLLTLLLVGVYLLWNFSFPSNANIALEELSGPTEPPPSSEATSADSPNNDTQTKTSTPTSVPVEEVGTQSPTIAGVVRAGAHPPAFTLSDLNGKSHSLLDHQGQVVLINFWTTWCPPCREEMPALQQTYERYKDSGFVVLGVNWTAADEPDLVGPYVEELGLTFPILLDEDSAVSEGQYNLLGLPTSVFVGRDGIIREIIIGALDLETLENKITSMIEDLL